jgi:predicted permease
VKVLDSIRMRAALFFRSDLHAEMEEELGAHIAHRADDLERGGLSRAEAERRARIEFGGREHYREESYAALGGNLMQTLLQDVRFALRILRKSKGFTCAAVLTLALAIGANAAVFGLLDALVLRPLHVSRPETLWGTLYGHEPVFQSYPNYADLRARNHSFEDLAAFNFAFVGLDTGNNPALATGFAVTGNYFDVFGVQPYLGRFFHSSDERGPNSAPFVVLSYAYWHSHFEDDRGVVGRTVLIDKHPFTILGVAPQMFRGSLFFVSPDFFLPIVNQEQLGGVALTDRANQQGIFEAFGHLKPGVTPEQATADVNAISKALHNAYPKIVADKPSQLGRESLTSFRGAVHAFIAGLMLLAGLILLAACANLGSLFAAHAADRSREVALRLALGSTRKRILRQLLTEAVFISLGGGVLGLWASVILLKRLSDWQPFPGAPIHIPMTIDLRIYGMAMVLAIVSGLLFGIVPVRQVLRANPYEVVKAGMSGVTTGIGRRVTLRDVLVVVQIAICAVLVTSSMVAVRGLARSLNANYGFDPNHTMVLTANLAIGGYTGDAIQAFDRRMIDAMATIPGVEHVGLVNNYPPLVYTAAFRTAIYKDETRYMNEANVAASPYRYDISPGYLEAAKTGLLAGRSFTWRDNEKDAPTVALVNRDFARRIFGSVSGATGRFFRMKDGTRVQIVGVVEDGKYMALTENPESTIFLPFEKNPSSQAAILVRSHRDPQELGAAIRAKLHSLDAGLPPNISPWTTLLDTVLFPARVATAALGALGIMGAILSITGIFGMAAYSVSKRMRELGIRVALGAKRGQVLGAALGRAVRLLAIGSAAGLVLGLLATRVLGAIVYQATPRDPIVLGGVVIAMGLLGLLATWIPAQRALSADPMILLREE